MSPQTLKMLIMFLLAAALLNITNYLFYWRYDPPSRHAMRLELQVPEHSAFLRRLSKRRATRIPKWSDFLLCENKNSSAVSPGGDKKLSGSPEYDYREQNPALYYYNGIKKSNKIICPEIPPGLGPLKTDAIVSPQEIEKLFNVLQPGGIYEETECTPRQSVAFFVTYRETNTNDEFQLLEFIHKMHSFLMKQQLEYQMFVVKQSNKTTPFNPGKLFNVGFSEAHGLAQKRKNGKWQCLVFQEHTILPADSRNLYRCSDHPQQLVTQIGNRSYRYEFGGAIAIKYEQFLKVNGFSNHYKTYNDAFEDLHKRLVQANYMTTKITTFGKYERVKYVDETNETMYHPITTIQTVSPLHLIDGLSTLLYTPMLIEQKLLYTLIEIDIDKPQLNTTDMLVRLLYPASTVSTTIKKTLA